MATSSINLFPLLKMKAIFMDQTGLSVMRSGFVQLAKWLVGRKQTIASSSGRTAEDHFFTNIVTHLIFITTFFNVTLSLIGYKNNLHFLGLI